MPRSTASPSAGHMDLIADFAFRLPVTVICEMLGIPKEEHEVFHMGARTGGRLLDPVPLSRAEIDEANAGSLMQAEYFRSLFELRRRQPGEDLTSQLVQAEEEGSKLSNEELTANIILLFGAGHETTVNLIGNGLLALARNPDQLRLLQSDPSLIANAIEEFLRYDSSVQLTGRTALEDVEVGGIAVAKGESVLCLLGAANRDPAVYPDPDRLDITRPNIRPLSFGGGIHFCLGAQLARIEGEVAIVDAAAPLPEAETRQPRASRLAPDLRAARPEPAAGELVSHARLQDHPRPRRQAQGRRGGSRKPAAQGHGAQGAGPARRRSHARRDGQARVLRGLRVERHRQEVAGLRGGLPRLRAEAALVPARRVLGGPGRRHAHRAQPAEDRGRARQCQVRGRHRPRARQLRQVPRPSGPPATRSACSSFSPSAARGWAAAPASISCASSARTASSPRPTSSPACATPASTSPRARPRRRTCRKIQDQFNAWAEETGLPLTHLSRICAMSIGQNYDAETLRTRGNMDEYARPPTSASGGARTADGRR